MAGSVDERWWRPFRKIGAAAVTYVDLSPHTVREEEALACLDGQERSRWQGFRLAGPRRRFVLCRAALRAVLCRQLGCENRQLSFAANRYGKPFALVDGTPAAIHFNVSHGGAHGLIASAQEGRLGVDVEERVPRRDLDGLISSVLGPGEKAELALARGSDKLYLFYNLWTIKEALLKALGTGLSSGMSEFEIPLGMRRGTTASIFRFPQWPKTRWRLEDLGTEDFAAAIAHEMGSGSAPHPMESR